MQLQHLPTVHLPTVVTLRPVVPEVSRVSFVADGGCLACRYDLTDELRTQTDTRQLELWSQEDTVIGP